MNPPSDEAQTPTDERELLELIADAEERVVRLREELERRREWRATSEELEAQHREIDRLAELLEQAKVDWRAVGAFVRSAVREQRAGQPWGGAAEQNRAQADGEAGKG